MTGEERAWAWSAICLAGVLITLIMQLQTYATSADYQKCVTVCERNPACVEACALRQECP